MRKQNEVRMCEKERERKRKKEKKRKRNLKEFDENLGGRVSSQNLSKDMNHFLLPVWPLP
jgi:hypothetical protein